MRRFTMLVVLGMVTATLALRAVAQTTYYVATCGDDSWSGLTDVCQAPDGPKGSIWAAVDAAADDDTVLVLPGAYGPFDIDKRLTIASTDGPAVTSLSGYTSDRFVISVGSDSLIEGFTIEDFDGGTGTSAALTLVGADLVVTNCVFQDCATMEDGKGHGGAVYAEGGSAWFRDCQFLRCFALGEGGGGTDDAHGGAVYTEGTDLSFERCLFVDNRCRNGGAIYSDSGTLSIKQCTFENNRALFSGSTWDGGSGGAVYAVGGVVSVVDSVFTGNRGDVSGGAILASNSSVQNSLFTANRSGNSLGQSTIVYAGSITQCLFTENIISTSNSPSGIARGLILDSTFSGNEARDNTFVVRPYDGSANILVYGNTGTSVEPGHDVTYSNIEGGYPGAGNIDADPMFVNAANGDYRLAAGSPSIDAGNNFDVPLGLTVDLAGQPRFRDDPATTDTGAGVARVVDMGAYEFQPGPFCGADFNDDGANNTLDVLAFLNAWVAEDPTADINADGTINTQDVLAFLNLWNAGC